jgi:hypothetical protein
VIVQCIDVLNILIHCSEHAQPAKVVSIEYPKEPSKEELYAWACLYK